MLTMSLTYFQEVGVPPDSLDLLSENVAPSQLDIIFQGGWIMLPIFLLSILTVYLLVERLIILRNADSDRNEIMARVREYVRAGNTHGAQAYCEAQKKPLTRILKQGLDRLGRPISEIQDAINAAGKHEGFQLERRMDLLASVAGIAPMLGFLGTVTGMIKAFQQIQNLQGNVDPSVLAGGIWEALVSTAGGMIVGILAFFFYNYLLSKINLLVNDMEQSATEFIDMLQAPVDETGSQKNSYRNSF